MCVFFFSSDLLAKQVPNLIMAIGRNIQNAVSTPNNKVKLTYQVHEDSLKTGASYTNPAKYEL